MIRSCVSCNQPLEPDARRAWRLCRGCSKARNARLIEVAATLQLVAPNFALARTDDGSLFYLTSLHARTLGLRQGDQLRLKYDPLAVVRAGQRPRAVAVARPGEWV